MWEAAIAKFPLVGPSYSSQSLNADCQSCINLYPEQIESGVGAAQIVLYSTPGTKKFSDLGGSSVRGDFETHNRAFAVCDANFCELQSNGIFTVRGVVANDSQMVSFAASKNQLLLASGGIAYVFDFAANTLTPIPSATFSGASVSKVLVLDNFFIVIIANSAQYYVSNAFDASTWNPANTEIVSFLIGNIIGAIVSHRELWLRGSENTVVYYDAGTLGIPFAVNETADIEQGTSAKDAEVILDNTNFWIGADARGKAICWRAAGYNPQRVSNHAIEFAMQGYARIDDARGYSYQDQGHSFWVIFFPTANKTWVYDVATGMWHERAYWEPSTATFTAHRSQCHMFVFGKHLVGDWKSGKVYEMAIPTYSNGTWLFADDDGNPIRRVRRATHISKEQKYMQHSQVQIYLETGLGPIPALPGVELPTIYNLADSTGAIWNLGMDDTGIIFTQSGFGIGSTLFLNDPGGDTTHSWQVVIDTSGVVGTIPIPYVNTYTLALTFVTSNGTQKFSLQVDASGILATQFIENVTRGPALMLRWSDDGGHSWSNEHQYGTGRAGEFATRVMARRLGRARDRVYEIAMSDPVPWRIIDGFVVVGNGA